MRAESNEILPYLLLRNINFVYLLAFVIFLA